VYNFHNVPLLPLLERVYGPLQTLQDPAGKLSLFWIAYGPQERPPGIAGPERAILLEAPARLHPLGQDASVQIDGLPPGEWGARLHAAGLHAVAWDSQGRSGLWLEPQGGPGRPVVLPDHSLTLPVYGWIHQSLELDSGKLARYELWPILFSFVYPHEPPGRFRHSWTTALEAGALGREYDFYNHSPHWQEGAIQVLVNGKPLASVVPLTEHQLRFRLDGLRPGDELRIEFSSSRRSNKVDLLAPDGSRPAYEDFRPPPQLRSTADPRFVQR
jgi:hypothetical protein